MSISSTKTAMHRMSAADFRAFQAGRPDHERWELVRGFAVMMTPPTLAHNRIAGNLERLLNDALAVHDTRRLAIQRPGVELGTIGDDYRPEPDVAVIDADYASAQRFVNRAYLLAEIVSATDYEPVPNADEVWLDVKRRLYRAHRSCETILVIEQDRFEVLVDVRTDAGWNLVELAGPGARLVLPGFGLECFVRDLYAGTPLQHRGPPSRAE